MRALKRLLTLYGCRQTHGSFGAAGDSAPDTVSRTERRAKVSLRGLARDLPSVTGRAHLIGTGG